MKIPRTVLEVIDGNLTRFEGPPRDMTYRMSTLAIVEREDGSRTEIEVEPYPVKIKVTPNVVQSLIADGTWTQEDLTPLGLLMTEEFDQEPTEGNQFDLSSIRFGLDAENKVRVQVDEIPIPPPPPPPTPMEKLERAGLTIEEFDQLVQESTARTAKAEPTGV